MPFTFTLERPASQQALSHRLNAEPEPMPEPAPAPLPDGSGRTVLVVDDNVDAALALAALLEASGFQVVVAHDGPSALALSQEWAPDYALLDIGMPEMDGYELAAHLRFAPGSEGMKVIAVTGRGLDEDARQSRARGFAAHLVKPVDLGQLANLLD
ncbi:MAG: response regulator [Betaproteobacteria bacterium]